MNLDKIFKMQKVLDDHIERDHPRATGEDRSGKKVLSLLVELGELANETRCFKFWSIKGPSKREIILEEGVDVLHFILSIGIDLGVSDVEFTVYKAMSLEEQFLSLFEQSGKCYSDHEWEWTFNLYLGLMDMLGFAWNEIEEAYIKKNAINHKRQEQGY